MRVPTVLILLVACAAVTWFVNMTLFDPRCDVVSSAELFSADGQVRFVVVRHGVVEAYVPCPPRPME
jgi:hypothetical protein